MLRWFYRRRVRDRELEDELQYHLEMLSRERLECGESPGAASAAAQRALGNRTLIQESLYEVWAWNSMEAIWQDLRFGLRIMVRNPGLATLAILTLALALGITTAVFSVLNAAVLRSLPVDKPNELVMLTDPDASMILGGLLTGNRSLLTYSEYEQLRSYATTLSDLCASQLILERWPVRIAGSEPEHARGRLVGESYFSTFGVRPAIGRLFTQSDATGAGKDPFAVISYRYWQQRFGGSPSAIGTTIHLRRASIVIIGVAANGFRGETVGQDPDIWLPMLMQPLVMPDFDGLHDTLPHSEDKLMWLHVFGRRKPGKTIAQVQAEVSVLFRAILDAGYPTTMAPQARKSALDQHIVVRSVGSGAFHGRKEFSQQWTLLLALASLILLIACVNVVNLLFARTTGRSREIAVRLSIGAGKARLIRQFLTENFLLAGAGGMAGFFVTEVAFRVLLSILADANDGFTVAADLDWRVLVFAICGTLLAGFIIGTIPAVRLTRGDINEDLKEIGRNVAGSRQRTAFGKTLVIAQVAVSLVLVIAAGLFVQTLWNLQSIAPGYPIEKLLLVQIKSTGLGGQPARNLMDDLVQRIGRIPDVRSVSYSDRGLFSGFEGAFPVEVEGFKSNREEDLGSTGDSAGPRYFSTIGIPLLMGRQIEPQDFAHAPRVCVINKAFADHFFAGRNPLGEHVTSVLSDKDGKSEQRRLQVIGVAENVRVQSLRGRIGPKFYVPGTGPWLEIRTAHNPGDVLTAVRKTIAGIDPYADIQSARTLKETVSAQNAQSRMIAQLATGFGVIALILAASGVFGVLSYQIGRRTNEIGVRMALGARPQQIATMIFQETGTLVFAGVTLGIAMTAAGTRLLTAQLYGLNATGPRWSIANYEHVDSTIQLYGVSALDPLTLSAAALLMLVLVWFAACFPAARASRIDPAQALRNE